VYAYLEIELVEAVERILMSVHVESIDRKVVSCQIEGFEHLAQREMLSITEDDHFLECMKMEGISTGLEQKKNRRTERRDSPQDSASSCF